MKKQLLFLFVLLSFNGIYAQLTATYSTTIPSCNTPSTIYVTATGGTAPYEYALDYSPVFQSANPMFQPSAVFNGIMSGMYSVLVKDALGATFSLNNIIINPPMLPNVFISSVTNAACSGDNGSIAVMVSGSGSFPYNLSLNGGPYIPIASNSFVFTNLTGGTYSITAMDSGGCVSSPATAVLNQPLPLVVSLSATQNDITATVTGGSGSYLYSLVNDANFAQASNVFNGLTPGVTYTVYVWDSNGCVVASTINTEVPVLGLTPNSTYFDYNNDGFTNVGDVVYYQLTLTNNGISPVTNIFFSSFGPTIVGGPLASLAGGTSDTTTFTGTYALTQADINSGSVVLEIQANGTYLGSTFTSSTTDVENLQITDGIKLNTFIDTNNNGVQDGAEQNANLGDFHYELNSNGVVHNVASSTGIHHIYETNPANTYNLSYVINNANPLQYSIATSSYNNITVAVGSGITTYNFAVTVLPYQDLEVNVLAGGIQPRPGFTYSNQLRYKNNGTQTIASGTLTYTKDNTVSIINVSQAGTSATANGFTYDFTNLLAGETRTIDVTMQVPVIPTVTLGQVVTNTASGTISGTDINATNNTSSLSQIIIGSYDPNDKMEAHGGKILHSAFTANDYLTYTIRFENTGTANAVNVRVNDVLDSKLDETSVRTISASHAYTLDRVGNNLNWNFNGIELEPSVEDTNIGHGYITFQVKPKAGYAVGDIIPNTADIYFDFNPAIVTNTFNTEFVAFLGVAEFDSNDFTAYPNPTNGQLTIALKDNSNVIDAVIVNDVLGKMVQTKTFTTSNAVLDLSNVSKGIYFVKVQSEGLEKVMKVVKQ